MGFLLFSTFLLQILFSDALVGPAPPKEPASSGFDFGPCLSHYTGIRGLPLNPLPRDCRQALIIGGGVDGVYVIFPLKVGECKPMMVYCDQGADGGGWTLIQRRMDGRLDFDRDWASYRDGFGSLHGEHWLGLEKIHALSMQDEYHLYVKMYRPIDRQMGMSEYFRFFVDSEETNYTMAVDAWDPSGNAGDSLSVHNGLPFSTWDRDNDAWTGNCALDYKSGWWFSGCHTANLNGLYLRQPPYLYAKGIVWQTYGGFRTSMIYSEMKIKPRFL